MRSFARAFLVAIALAAFAAPIPGMAGDGPTTASSPAAATSWRMSRLDDRPKGPPAKLARLGETLPDETSEADRIRDILSPHVEGDVLIIEGKIDSHIYDYIQYEAANLVRVKIVDLNSLGGNTEWALAIARKITELGKTTRVRSGHYCASACAYLFAAGRDRVAAEDSWIGIHGARLGAGYLTNFQGLCLVDMEDGSQFEPRKKGCQDFLRRWYAVAMASTNEGFDIMEANGVSRDLRQVYFDLPDDPDWPAHLNVLRKPDWTLESRDAVKYNLVTMVLPKGGS